MSDGEMAFVTSFVEQRLSPSVTDPHDARGRLADATRALIRRLATSSVAGADAEEAITAIARATALLDAGADGRPFLIDGEGRRTFDYCPLMGWLNPMAPPMRLWHEQDRVVASVTFGPQFEGPPGCVHGGFVAAAFDEVLGVAHWLTGEAGMTAHIEVHYRAPTPLLRELRFVGTVERVEGRKIYASATLRDGERLCAEGTGLFVVPRPGVVDGLLRDRDDAS